jgi:hypothetical protein
MRAIRQTIQHPLPDWADRFTIRDSDTDSDFIMLFTLFPNEFNDWLRIELKVHYEMHFPIRGGSKLNARF